MSMQHPSLIGSILYNEATKVANTPFSSSEESSLSEELQDQVLSGNQSKNNPKNEDSAKNSQSNHMKSPNKISKFSAQPSKFGNVKRGQKIELGGRSIVIKRQRKTNDEIEAQK